MVNGFFKALLTDGPFTGDILEVPDPLKNGFFLLIPRRLSDGAVCIYLKSVSHGNGWGREGNIPGALANRNSTIHTILCFEPSNRYQESDSQA